MSEASRAARAEEALRASEARFRTLFDDAADYLLLLETDGAIVDVNARACAGLGYERSALLGMDAAHISADGQTAWWRSVVDLECTFRGRDGRPIRVEVRVSAIEVQGRSLVLATARDVTDRNALEARLRQATKMEAVGRLAGGVAHDFNNLLTVILTYTQFLSEDIGPDSGMHSDVKQIRKAAQRASALTHQLLAFSRRQVLQPAVVAWRDVVADLEPLLRRLIGEDVALTTRNRHSRSRFLADHAQLGQVIMNLVVNAREAMPKGGRLTIETYETTLEHEQVAREPGLVPGTYAVMEVIDTGNGMDADTLDNLWEPFFTTKSDGTGLGLAMVYGIVKQSEGFIYAHSVPGAGTTFRLYMPALDAHAAAPALPPQPFSLGDDRGDEVILVVEDEEMVRTVAIRTLSRRGYKVLSACDAHSALRIVARMGGAIDLLLTDVVMPQMGGGELAEHLSASYPEIRVLYMTGYTDDALVRHGASAGAAALIRKPFTADALARKVRQVLDVPALPPRKLKVLLVDDQRAIRTAMIRVLDHMDCTSAASVGEARQIVGARGPFDAVLCDLSLGEESGLDLHRWLRTTHPALAASTVMITGGVPSVDERAYLQEHIPVMLTKPVRPDRLSATIAEAAQGRQVPSQLGMSRPPAMRAAGE